MVVDIPKDVSRNTCKYEYPKSIDMRSYNPVNKGHSGQIRKAVRRCCRVPGVRTSTPAAACGAGQRQRRTPASWLGDHRPPGHQHADGPGLVPRHEQAVRRHARHARHV
ncbi:hypothetical protein ACTMU2_09225 [Cupriavidus basilensis]